jgi:hypothetical protein
MAAKILPCPREYRGDFSGTGLETQARQLKHKPLLLPDELSEEITRRTRMKGVPDADCIRLSIEPIAPGERENGDGEVHFAGLVGLA